VFANETVPFAPLGMVTARLFGSADDTGAVLFTTARLTPFTVSHAFSLRKVSEQSRAIDMMCIRVGGARRYDLERAVLEELGVEPAVTAVVDVLPHVSAMGSEHETSLGMQ
jgi:hypothetical protein